MSIHYRCYLTRTQAKAKIVCPDLHELLMIVKNSNKISFQQKASFCAAHCNRLRDKYRSCYVRMTSAASAVRMASYNAG